MDMTKPETAGSEARVRRAVHAGEAYDRDLAECREVIDERSGLHYIAHVTCGIIDFAVERPDLGGSGQDRPGAFDRAGRQLSLIVAELDRVCEPLDSGSLIRVVIQGRTGAFFHVLKVAGQGFFGVTLDSTAEAVEQADRQLAQLAESAAHRIGAVSLQWGGFRSREDSGELWLPYQTSPLSPYSATHHRSASSGSIVTGPVKDLCRSALQRDDLHFVGIYHHDQLTWSTDIFEDPALEPFFQRVTPSARRQGYDQVLHQVTMQARRLGSLLRLTGDEQLGRLVLDVARGAVYVMPIGDDYLVGVTFIQAQVERADQKMRTLHGRLTTLVGAPAVASLGLPDS
jgi:hypothetical protein